MFPLGSVAETAAGERGFVRYVGEVENRKGTFVGLELFPEYAESGKNRGVVDGKEYFKTRNGDRTGIFLPVDKCKLASSIAASPSSSPKGSENYIASPAPTSLPMSPNLQSSIPRLTAFPPNSNLNVNSISSTALTPTEKILQKRIEDLLFERQTHQQQLEEVLSSVDQLQALVTNFTDQQDELDELRERITMKEERIQQMREEASQRRHDFKTTIEYLEDSTSRVVESYEHRISELEFQLEAYSSDKQGETIITLCQERNEALSHIEVLEERLEKLLKSRTPAENGVVNGKHQSIMESGSPTLTNISYESHSRGKASRELPENHPQRRQTLEFYEIEIEVLRNKAESLQADCEEKNYYIGELEARLGKTSFTTSGTEPKHSSTAEREKLLDRITELESTIERMTLHDNLEAKNLSSVNSIPANAVSQHTDNNSVWCEVCENSSHTLAECPTVFGTKEEN
ncbi:CLIP170 family protein Tip1 [Schizosaccharomyces cryophilus OY26]|uniref:CLIP170 family protein Tip1 n=1 Tax=Schizosaccharomyces cryophilus (strain OY26 / ATCC MYA-4695 / CBS 11777 / NBRC 106824 / NRRL Y48691) TaxID=653667 RepID=S9XCY7_SCHCR|nr:CLIP170 family protein Tip1 [Schizosaccharomyces cryophilus OY26]EPY51706.1 CLIP170 family protein Tip1 [Schizosaccharomyces cryophilus OY26]